MALIYADEDVWNALSDGEREAIYERYRTFDQEARTNGAIVDGAELAPSSAATTVRVRDGETLVSDGPFAETKEALGGYYLLECGSLDEALALAARIPGADHGAVEVRPTYGEESS
ncbi:MAG: YciI family protein [Thermoleophilia bacterium]|nr:YciI family protein [Thermoleophilia bacterium]